LLKLSDYYQIVCPFIDDGCVSPPVQEQTVTDIGARPEQVYRQTVVAVKELRGVVPFPVHREVSERRTTNTAATGRRHGSAVVGCYVVSLDLIV
jgi:hypothetical protein